MNFGKTLFGFKPSEVKDEIQRMDKDYKEQIAKLEKEIEEARKELNEYEEKISELKGKVDEHIQTEREIAGVMVTAQKNAQRIEEEAREKARKMLQNTEETLEKKQEELEFLRVKVQNFKEDFRDTLDKYRLSIETMKDPGDESHFAPTLITNDKEKNKKQDISS